MSRINPMREFFSNVVNPINNYNYYESLLWDLNFNIKEIKNIIQNRKEKALTLKTNPNPNELNNFKEFNKLLIQKIDECFTKHDTARNELNNTLYKYNAKFNALMPKIIEILQTINKNKLDYGLQGQLRSTFKNLPSKPVMTANQQEIYDELMSNPDIKVGTNGYGGKKRSYKKRSYKKRRTNKRKQTKRTNKRRKSRK